MLSWFLMIKIYKCHSHRPPPRAIILFHFLKEDGGANYPKSIPSADDNLYRLLSSHSSRHDHFAQRLQDVALILTEVALGDGFCDLHLGYLSGKIEGWGLKKRDI